MESPWQQVITQGLALTWTGVQETVPDGGQVLMPLDAYLFSQHYGWVRTATGSAGS